MFSSWDRSRLAISFYFQQHLLTDEDTFKCIFDYTVLNCCVPLGNLQEFLDTFFMNPHPVQSMTPGSAVIHLFDWNYTFSVVH